MELSAESITQHWPLDRVRLGETLQRYPSRSVQALRSDQGSFVVKEFDDAFALGLVHPTTEQIHQAFHVFDYLFQRGFPHIPRLLKTRAGETFVRVDGKTLYLMERVEGSAPVPSVDTYRALGEAAGKLRAFTD